MLLGLKRISAAFGLLVIGRSLGRDGSDAEPCSGRLATTRRPPMPSPRL